MKYLVSGSKMKEIDSYSINTIGIPGAVLMERSALAVAAAVEERAGRKDRILAVCGTGNNGGDGMAACRLLKEKGYSVEILILGDEKRATESTKLQLRIARNLGVPTLNNAKIKEYNVIIDAMFGIGLDKPIGGVFETVINEINAGENTVFAVDIPSGIHSASGKIMHAAVKADITVTFGLYKTGLILHPGREYSGRVILADIGFPNAAIEAVRPNTFIYEPSDLSRLPRRLNYSNKGTFGKVLVIAGSKNMCGACLLSAKAAYRTGAGLVKVLTVEDNRTVMQADLPEALLTTYDPGNLKNKLEVDRITKELAWATAVVIGPGMGMTNAAAQLLDIVMQGTKVPIIVDADALNILSLREEFTEEKLTFTENFILTPHLLEMARLLDRTVDEIREDLIKTAVEATRGKKFTLALKDARTVVTNGNSIYVNVSGNNGLATGGAGDVLTGIIAALLAQGMEQFEAAALGVYIHGLAADAAVEEKNLYSLMAGDIIEALCTVLK